MSVLLRGGRREGAGPALADMVGDGVDVDIVNSFVVTNLIQQIFIEK